MAADTSSREIAREVLATLLTATLTGGGNPVQAVYNYRIADELLKVKEMPLTMIYSAGSDPTARSGGGTPSRLNVTHILEVATVVLDAKGSETWTEANVEETLDRAAKIIMDTVADNSNTADWGDLKFLAPSTIFAILVGGESYQMEVFKIGARKRD